MYFGPSPTSIPLSGTQVGLDDEERGTQAGLRAEIMRL